MPTYSAVWDESMAGRLGTELASILHMMLTETALTNAKHIIIWCDNCIAQNKNYILYNMLQMAFHDMHCTLSISLKYFESGHTFMSADNVHRSVEHEMKRMKNVVSLEDFEACVRQATSHTQVLKPDLQTFKDFPGRQLVTSKRSIKLESIREIKFTKNGDTSIRLSFDQPSRTFKYLKSGTIFQSASTLSLVREVSRGVSAEMKRSLDKDVIPIILKLQNGAHAHKARFFKNLRINDLPDSEPEEDIDV